MSATSSFPLSVRYGVLHLTGLSLPEGWEAGFASGELNEVYLDAAGLQRDTILQNAQAVRILIISKFPILEPLIVGPFRIPQDARLISALSTALIRATERTYQQYCDEVVR